MYSRFNLLIRPVYGITRGGYLNKFRNIYYYYLSDPMKASYPSVIWITVNNRCNLRCKICDIGTLSNSNCSDLAKNTLSVHQENINLPLSSLSKLIDEVRIFKPFISINTTEPFLYPYILEACKIIKKNKLKLRVFTNGVLLGQFARDIILLGLDELAVSLDGPPKVHNKIRGRDESFQQTLWGLKRIEKFKLKMNSPKPRIWINYTINNENCSCILEFIKYILGNLSNVNFLHFTHMGFISKEIAQEHNRRFGKYFRVSCSTTFTDPSKVDIRILNDQIKMAKCKFKKKIKFYPDLDYRGLKTYYQEPLKFVSSKKTRCLWNGIQLNPRGDMIPFYRCFNVVLGNLNYQSFEEIWEGEQIKKLRMLLRKYGAFPVCKRCCAIFSTILP